MLKAKTRAGGHRRSPPALCGFAGCARVVAVRGGLLGLAGHSSPRVMHAPSLIVHNLPEVCAYGL